LFIIYGEIDVCEKKINSEFYIANLSN